jgi:hypothetical protein
MSEIIDIRVAVKEGLNDYRASFREVVMRTLPIYALAEVATLVFGRPTAATGAIASFSFLLFIVFLQALGTYIVTGIFLQQSSRNVDGFRWEFLPTRFLALVTAFLLISAGMAVGLILFVLPGVLFAAATLFTTIYIVRDGMSMPMALQESIALARPHLWSLASLALIIIAVTLGAGLMSGAMSGARAGGNALPLALLGIAISILTLAIDAIVVSAFYQIAGRQMKAD